MNQENNNFNNMFGMSNVPENPQQNSSIELNNMTGSQPVQQSMPNVQPNSVVNEFSQPVQQPMPNVQPNSVVNEFSQPVQQSNVQPTIMQSNNGKKKNKFLLPLLIGIAAIVLISTILIFAFTGNKTLVCTNTQTSYGIKMNMEAKMEFKRNRVKSVDALITVDLGSYKNQKDVFVQQFEKQFGSYGQKGVKLDITSDDTKIYINMKASKDNYSAIDLFSSENYNKVKEELEKDGFTCE